MNIAIIHFGEPWQVIAATPIVQGLKINHKNCAIDWFSSEATTPFIKYNKMLRNVSHVLPDVSCQYDIIMNLFPETNSAKWMHQIASPKKCGFIFDGQSLIPCDKAATDFFNMMFIGEMNEKTIVQLYFRMAGLKWKGEGYNLSYYPRSKSKKNKTGIAIENTDLRSYVKNNLKLEMSDLWHIPMRKNLLKRIDEINRCKNIITDDIFTLHVGLALRKHVEFLDCKDININFEFFGNGSHHRIINNVFQ